MGWFGWLPDTAKGIDVNELEMAMRGRRNLLAMMGLAKAPPERTAVDGRSWQAFKQRHNMRYQYLEDQRRREKRRAGGGEGDG